MANPDLAILTGLPLFRDSSSASSCASRSMRSASLLMRRERSVPVTFFPQVVLNASRAAATASSTSFAEPGANQSERRIGLGRTGSLIAKKPGRRSKASSKETCTPFPNRGRLTSNNRAEDLFGSWISASGGGGKETVSAVGDREKRGGNRTEGSLKNR